MFTLGSAERVSPVCARETGPVGPGTTRAVRR